LTFRDLQKVIEPQTAPEQSHQLLQRLSYRPFWYWDQALHKLKTSDMKGEGSFKRMIGLPQKDGHDIIGFSHQLHAIPPTSRLPISVSTLQPSSHIWTLL
jgi:hypothetical protein